MSTKIRNSLLSAGVKNLKEFGYPSVNEKNILTDTVYKAFFLKMLEDNLGKMAAGDFEITKLMKEIKDE